MIFVDIIGSYHLRLTMLGNLVLCFCGFDLCEGC